MLPDTANQALKVIGIEQTKVGGGDKERAYIIKQNAMLKVGLTVFGILMVLGAVLSFTVLDVKVHRRSTVMAKLHQRHEQHAGHTDMIKKDLKLQNVLREEKNDAEMIRDARATVGALLASYHDNVMDVLKVNPTAQKEVEKHNKNFAKYLAQILNDLFLQAKKEEKSADEALEQVNKNIVAEENKDEAEETEFKDEMTAMGEDTKELEAEAAAEEGTGSGEDEGEMHDGHSAAEGDNTKGAEDESVAGEDVQKQLTRFFAKADAAEKKYGHLAESALEEVFAFREKNQKKVAEVNIEDATDKTKEDFDKTKLEEEGEALLKKHGLTAWSEQKTVFPEIVDYFDDLADHRGYSKYKADIDALRSGIKNGDMTANKVVAELEKLEGKSAGLIPLHWMWAEEAEVGFDQDETYSASITPEEEAAAEIDNEAHADMPLADDATSADAEGGPVKDALTGTAPPISDELPAEPLLATTEPNKEGDVLPTGKPDGSMLGDTSTDTSTDGAKAGEEKLATLPPPSGDEKPATSGDEKLATVPPPNGPPAPK